MPNLAIATELQSNSWQDGGQDCGQNTGSDCGVEILYVGSKSDLDRKLVESAGFQFKSIYTGKLRRYFSLQNFIDPFFIIAGLFQSLWIVICFWPDVVFAKGGFVSLPVALAAFILRRPIVLHESDRIMGLSNRIVAKLATKICVVFPDCGSDSGPNSGSYCGSHGCSNSGSHGCSNSGSNFCQGKVVFTGSPVRGFIKDGDREAGYKITGFRPEKPVVLIWGGSQGSQEINAMAEAAFHDLKSIFQMAHITGYGKKTSISDPAYRQFEYLGDDLKHIYSITDIVVGRAGANSLFELALMQKPNILIPLQSSAHNHQQLNAEYFEQMGASIILRDKSLSEILKALWHSPEERERMKEALAKLSVPNAAERIAELLLTTTRRNDDAIHPS
jgi:UDP-N-acetylglucosamine--N-acetylmuramyl-(pentapeptide) pyrophosphoryl-undecaprenol N-acetylglucosamine transferase